MNAYDFIQSPENMDGGLPMSLSPGLPVPCGAAAGPPGLPPPPLLPPGNPPPPPPPRGTPPGIPGFPLKGVWADQTGNPHPEKGCSGGSG